MDKITVLFLSLSFFSSAATAQVETRTPYVESGATNFWFDALTFQSRDSSTCRVDAYLQIPYSELKFVAAHPGFVARYEITIDILHEDGSEVFEKSWDGEVWTRTFEETESPKGSTLTQRSFPIPPGSYTMRVQLREMESGKVSLRIKKIVAPDYSRERFGLSDIMLVNRATTDSGHTSIDPNVTGNLYDTPNGFFIFFEVYNAVGADSVRLTYRVLDEKDRSVYVRSETSRLDGRVSDVITKIDSLRLSVGTYTLEVTARSNPDTAGKVFLEDTRARSFLMHWVYVPLTMRDLDLAIQQARYIATNDEFHAMVDAKTFEEKQKLFIAFWHKRDPSPDTLQNENMDEYYSRVQYANDHFSHYIDGWRTDMGMVFILLGAPNGVDRHPFNEDSKPYEVWDYNDYNAQVVFVDETGLGDYRLITPIWDIVRQIKK
ncbi:MAG TPA: GWxTD domain-containing protein [Bacteroidota bacterium]|nr:GWxTD domain-containing protein [Bacteroidota bacterium]